MFWRKRLYFPSSLREFSFFEHAIYLFKHKLVIFGLMRKNTFAAVFFSILKQAVIAAAVCGWIQRTETEQTIKILAGDAPVAGKKLASLIAKKTG